MALADPVALHLLDALRPVDQIEVVEQAFGVLGDLEHPLAHQAPLDRVAGLDVGAVLDLLVGEHGAQRRAPVDRHVGHVGEALLVELEEDPLCPTVVVGGGGVDLALPVVGEAEALDLLAEGVDVALGDGRRVQPLAHRGALGGQPEGVPAHRMEDVEALGALHPRHDVGRGVALGVADVEAGAGGVGEHVEHVVLGLRTQLLGVGRRPEGTALGPDLLPLGLDD